MSNVSIDGADDSKSSMNSKRRKMLWRVLVLVVLIWPPLAWVAAKSLIVRADLPKADVAVVLAGSSTYVERSQYAAQIFKEGRVSRIFISNDGQQGGWSNADQRNPLFVERTARELEAAGVPRDKIEVLPQVVTSTFEEAVMLRQYADEHELRSILIVTSAYHSRRALWTLRSAFESSRVELGIASPPTGLQTPPPATWWLHLSGWRLVAGEWAKLVYYRIRY